MDGVLGFIFGMGICARVFGFFLIGVGCKVGIFFVLGGLGVGL